MSATGFTEREEVEQAATIKALGVQRDFDAAHEIAGRVQFLKSYLIDSRQTA